MKESHSMEQLVSDAFGGHFLSVLETFPAKLQLLPPSFSPDKTSTPLTFRHTEWNILQFSILSLKTVRSYRR